MKQTMSKAKAYAVFILIPLVVGALSAFLTSDAMKDFSRVNQPPLSPPAWLFPIVWTALYTLMGIGAARVYLSGRDNIGAIRIFFIQLAINFFWSILFFNFDAYLIAFLWLLLLIAAVIVMTRRFFYCDSLAGKLQIPYIVWLVFAAYLNFMIYMLNK